MANVKWQGDISTDPTVAGNWDTAAVPAAGEHVVFDGTATGNCAGGAIAADIGSLTITDDCTINIGTSHAVPLAFTCTAGLVTDMGSGTRYLAPAAAARVVEMGSGTVDLDGADNVLLLINAPSATVTVGDDPWGANTCDFTTVIVEAGLDVVLKNVETAADGVYTLHIRGGTVETWSGLVEARQTGGVWTHRMGAVTNMYLSGGECRYNATETIGTKAYVYSGGKLNFTYAGSAVTVAACEFRAGATSLDPWGRVTWTAAPEGHNCSVKDCTLDFGFHKKYTIAAI